MVKLQSTMNTETHLDKGLSKSAAEEEDNPHSNPESNQFYIRPETQLKVKVKTHHPIDIL